MYGFWQFCWLFVLLLFFFFWAGILSLIFTLLIAHVGYLHLVRTLDRCSSSFCNIGGLEQIDKSHQHITTPPLMWKMFVDYTCVIIRAAHKQEFLEHINSVDPHIQFTSEDSKPDGSMPFLDMLITPTEEGRLNTTVCRKPTLTDMYLKWDSHHPISSKYSVVGTLHHRAKTVCSSPHMLQKRRGEHLSRVLTRCKYPTWAINRVKIKLRIPAQKKKNNSSTNNQQNCQKPYMVVPYYQGLSESVKRTWNKHGIQVYFRGGVTIKNLLMAPKDQDPMLKKSRVIYRYKCDRVECDEEYIGESSRTFGEGFKEHQKAPSPIYDHYNTSGHLVSIDNFNIVGREDQEP